jgi:hypothetical protein
MSELTTYNLTLFNQHLLKFRIRYYFKETGELLLRHKLLVAFVFCLLAPGLKNISLIGVPFTAIVDPDIPLVIKLISLTCLLTFLFLFIKAQTNSITGGEFGDYLFIIQTSSPNHKKIDLVVLVLSLNVIWFALFLGAKGLSTSNSLLLYSYYVLYGSLIIALIIFLLTVLYKNTRHMVLLMSVCMLIAVASIRQNALLNFSISLLSVFAGILVAYKIQPYKQKNRIAEAPRKKITKSFIHHSFKLFFLTQIATIRAHRLAFIIRFSICIFLSFGAINLISSDQLSENILILLLILSGVQTYILSTLVTFFSKNEQDFRLLHFIVNDNLLMKRAVEVICIFGGLLLSLLPLMIYLAFTNPSNVELLIGVMTASTITIIINRILYLYSLRFCFFTSLINMVASIVMQYLLIGVILGK